MRYEVYIQLDSYRIFLNAFGIIRGYGRCLNLGLGKTQAK